MIPPSPSSTRGGLPVDVSNGPPTLTITEAAQVLGIGRNLAYELARRGDFPAPVLKLGNRLVVPRQPLLELVGLNAKSRGSADGCDDKR